MLHRACVRVRCAPDLDAAVALSSCAAAIALATVAGREQVKERWLQVSAHHAVTIAERVEMLLLLLLLCVGIVMRVGWQSVRGAAPIDS